MMALVYVQNTNLMKERPQKRNWKFFKVPKHREMFKCLGLVYLSVLGPCLNTVLFRKEE